MQRSYSENLVKRTNNLKFPGGGGLSTGGGDGGNGDGDTE